MRVKSCFSMCAPVWALVCVLAAAMTTPLLAGPLTPPLGPVAPTAKPLAEVEPRTAISLTNTPGDADSLFRITQPGSYYLTGNITGVVAKSGIEVAVENVTIDLNGFELVGAPGSLEGVTAGSISATRLKNGTVRNWGSNGVNIHDFAVMSGVTARDNAGFGIDVGQSSVVTECLAEGNAGHGIGANAGTVLSLCTSRNNTLDGFSLNSCTTTGCTSRVNGGNGFTIQNAGSISLCTGSNNGGTGISVGSGGTFGTLVSDCAFSFNGDDGISVVGNSTIRGCTLHGNGSSSPAGAGIRVTSSDCRIEGNHCTDNDRGIVVSAAGNFIVRNTCATNATNWDIVANNIVGPVLDRTAPASAAILGNGGPGSLGTTDPNANFSH